MGLGRKLSAHGKRYIGIFKANAFQLVLTGQGNGTRGINQARSAVGAFLLGRFNRILARDNHAHVFARQIIGEHKRCTRGAFNIGEMRIIRRFVGRNLPLVRYDIFVVERGMRIAFGGFGRKRIAHLGRPRHGNAVQRNRARNRNGAHDRRSPSTETAVGARNQIFALIGIGYRELTRRGAFYFIGARIHRTRFAPVPLPGDAFIFGNIDAGRLRRGGKGVAHIRLARFVENNADHVHGTRSRYGLSAARGIRAFAHFRRDNTTDRFSFVCRKRERVPIGAFDIDVIAIAAALLIAFLPLVIQLGGIDEGRNALLFGARPYRCIGGE